MVGVHVCDEGKQVPRGHFIRGKGELVSHSGNIVSGSGEIFVDIYISSWTVVGPCQYSLVR